MSDNNIINSLDNHSKLESLYQEDQTAFAVMLSEAMKFKPESETLKTWQDRKSTRLNSSHVVISYAVCCLKKQKQKQKQKHHTTDRTTTRNHDQL